MKPFAIFLFAAVLAMGFARPVYAQPQQETPNSATGFDTRLSMLEDALRSMNGQIEQLTYASRQQDQTIQRMQTDYEARLSKLEQTQQQLIAQIQALQKAQAAEAQTAAQPPVGAEPNEAPVTTASGTLGNLKLQDGRVTGGTINPHSTPLPTPPPDYGLTPQEQYDRAFKLLRQADYDKAEVAFKTFIAKNPKSKLLDNAKYWYAETLYVRSQFAAAAIAFADAYQENPHGPKAPDSLLKLAMALANSGKRKDACTTLLQLKSSYPHASGNVRARAKEEHAKLKCSGH